MFGEMAPLTAQRLREAYAEAAEPSDVCVLKREDPERLVRGIPDDVGLRMIRGLSERLRVCETRLEDVGFRDVPARLASLHPTAHRGRRRYDRRGTRIPTRYTHRQLATMIGASRESVTRAFTKLRRGGVVELRRRRIYVKDVAAPERTAG